ncbi:MAG: GNAT family N-acetyltransferase [Anaerolineales bacterium]|nr:GNAT family N-acetyltransferase [Anaerolineales bacterium]
MTRDFVIRRAVPEDLPELVRLCAEHAEFEQAAYSPHGKAERLKAHLFGKTPACFCLVAEMDAVLSGYATYSKEFSTWDAGFYIHMDCLFLRPHARGLGLGEHLIKQIKQEARSLGCQLIQWQTPKFNTRAIKFYKRIGAMEKEKMRFFLTVE